MAKNTQISSSLKKLLEDFKVYMLAANKMKEGSIASYIDYLKAVEKFGGNNTITWLNRVILQRAEKPIAQLEKYFEDYLDEHPPYSDKNEPIKPTYISKLKSALRLLGEFVFRYTNADVNMSSISLDTELEPLLCQLVAQSAIFCSKDVFEAIQRGELGSRRNRNRTNTNPNDNIEGTWDYYGVKRAKSGQKNEKYVEETIKGHKIKVRLDSNNYANKAIKEAILADLKEKHGDLYKDSTYRKFKDFEACHIWDETCYDARYHTSVANLVLLPRGLAGLTDHYSEVKKMLQYEAWRRFNFLPKDKDNNDMPFPEPTCPKFYDDLIWLHSPK